MPKGIKLSILLQQIQSTIEFSMPDTYWVIAEISSLNEKNGHCYLELVEKSDENGFFSAKVRATCWANTWSLLKAYFYQQTNKNIEVGMKVLIEVKASFHPVYGFSLQIYQIDPTYTLGELAQKKDKTIQQLKLDGVFDMQRHIKLPTIINRIAVISSPDAAGYDDFINQLSSNNYGFAFSTTLFPAIMQGDRAEQSCLEALYLIFDRQEEFDVVVIIRGGGANTDLTCFDSYTLSFACAQFPLPIISGIGHTRDVSVLDMIAAVSVKTPTAVAEFLINRSKQQQDLIISLQSRLFASADKRVLMSAHKLQILETAIANSYMQYIGKQRYIIDTAYRTIELLSPESIFNKGYTLTRINNKVIRDVKEVKKGDILTTELKNAKIESRVI